MTTSTLDPGVRRGERVDLGEAERGILNSLEEQVKELTLRWRSELSQQLRSRPKGVPSHDTLLDHMALVRWSLFASMRGSYRIEGDALDELRRAATYWWESGYAVEESLLHFRILDSVLQSELRDRLSTLEGPLRPAAGARLAESVSHGVMLVQAVVVGLYRDLEDERAAAFGSVLAHEIRGPLSSALTTLQIVRALDGKRGASQEGLLSKVLQRLESSLWETSQVVDSVQSIALPRHGEPGPQDYTPLREIVSTILAEIEVESGRVRVACEGELPDIRVPLDSVLLGLHNLVQNAIAYADPEEPDPWVRIACAKDPETGRWLLRVHDNGVGISPSEQRVIFERFRRGRTATGRGFGLGLSIVREAALRMGGEVLVDSEPGRGSTFTIAVPADRIQK